MIFINDGFTVIDGSGFTDDFEFDIFGFYLADNECNISCICIVAYTFNLECISTCIDEVIMFSSAAPSVTFTSGF